MCVSEGDMVSEPSAVYSLSDQNQLDFVFFFFRGRRHNAACHEGETHPHQTV